MIKLILLKNTTILKQWLKYGLNYSQVSILYIHNSYDILF